jgi:hypothetical protein
MRLQLHGATVVPKQRACALSPRMMTCLMRTPRSSLIRGATSIDVSGVLRPLSVTATATTGSVSAAPAAVAPEGKADGFDWLGAWYPVAIISQLDARRPTPVQLLGRRLVLWQDGDGQCVALPSARRQHRARHDTHGPLPLTFPTCPQALLGPTPAGRSYPPCLTPQLACI